MWKWGWWVRRCEGGSGMKEGRKGEGCDFFWKVWFVMDVG